MAQKYGDRTNIEPFRRGIALVNNTTVEAFDAVYVGVGGILEILTSEGSTVTLTGALAGTIYPFEGTKITSNTTATSCVGLYH